MTAQWRIRRNWSHSILTASLGRSVSWSGHGIMVIVISAVREVAMLGGESGAEGDDEEALSLYSRDTNSPLHIQRVKTFSLNNM